MLEKYRKANAAKSKKAASLPTPKAAAVNLATLEDEEAEQLSVVEQFKKVKAEQQTLMEKLKQKYK